MPTRAELLAALEESGADLPADLDDQTPLITSGLLDSTALFVLQRYLSRWADPHQVNIADWEGVDERGNVRARSAGLLLRRLDDSAPDRPWRLGSRDPLSIEDWDLRMIDSMAA